MLGSDAAYNFRYRICHGQCAALECNCVVGIGIPPELRQRAILERNLSGFHGQWNAVTICHPIGRIGYGVYSCAVTQNNACLDAVAINDNILANNRQQRDICTICRLNRCRKGFVFCAIYLCHVGIGILRLGWLGLCAVVAANRAGGFRRRSACAAFVFDHDDAAGVIHTVTFINRHILTLYQRTVLIATLQCLACQKRSNIIRLRKERTCNDHAHIQCQLSVCHCVELVQPHTAFDMDGGTGVYINGVVTGTGNRANTIRACHGHVTAADQKCMGIRAFPFLPVQVNGKRAAVDHDLCCGRHIRQQFHGAAFAVLRRRDCLRQGGVLCSGVVDGDLRHSVFHGAVPAVLNGNAIFLRLFRYGGRFRSRSFLLLLLLLFLHDGAALRRVRFRRPCGGGQERQAQGQCHEHTQYSFFHIFPP